MEEVKKEGEKIEKDVKEEGPKMRQILILTDGNEIKLDKAEVSGKIELMAILQNLLNFLNEQGNESKNNNRKN